MATIAIGDIHGNLPALAELLGQLRRESGPNDTIVFLGDYIDRGPATKQCIDAILAFRHDVQSHVVCLCGNHEDWLLRTMHDYRRHSWLLGMEAFETIRSYSVDAERQLRDAAAAAGVDLYLTQCALPYDLFFETVPTEHIQFFESLAPYYHDSECIYAHGGLDPAVTRLEDQPRNALIWGGDGFPAHYRGTEFVIYGHRDDASLESGWPNPRIIGRTESCRDHRRAVNVSQATAV